MYLQRACKRIILVLNGPEQSLFLLPVSHVRAGSTNEDLQVSCGLSMVLVCCPVHKL